MIERKIIVFSGCPVMKDGYLYANECARLGASKWMIKAAAKYPYGMFENGDRKNTERRLGRDPQERLAPSSVISSKCRGALRLRALVRNADLRSCHRRSVSSPTCRGPPRPAAYDHHKP